MLIHRFRALTALSGVLLGACVTVGAPGQRGAANEPSVSPAVADELGGGPVDAVAATAEADAQAAVEPEQPAVPLSPLDPVVVTPGQVEVFRRGERSATISIEDARIAGLFVMDLGRGWVPRLFRSKDDRVHAYEETFVHLANAEFDDSPQGRRARQDQYLELYGIPPSPALLETRYRELAGKACMADLSLARVREFAGVTWDEGHATPSGPVPQGVLDELKARLRCEGHLREGSGKNFDNATRRALEEFERRNRIYARANLDGATLKALQTHPLELERRSLVRALAERMVLDLGVIEDGSGVGVTPKTARGERALPPPPNLVARIEERVTSAFGLQTVAGMERFYKAFADPLSKPHGPVAIDTVDVPRYQTDDMDLFVEIDRGDIYFEFPMDSQGQPREQPVEEGPTLSLFTHTKQGVVPLVRYKTTIGGWRKQHVSDQSWWVYKESPVGPRVWTRVVSTPVWLPPADTPPQTLVVERGDEGNESQHEVNYNLVGPGYASAYGLVAAYHERSARGDEEGRHSDEGIRSHGSSDYTSIWRRSSHGCHRLYNHQAVRLFNFVVAHRAHRRIGHRAVGFRLPVSVEDFSGAVEVSRTGYVFDLSRPVPVEVLPGRVRGLLKHPSNERIPVMPPDGTEEAVGLSD